MTDHYGNATVVAVDGPPCNSTVAQVSPEVQFQAQVESFRANMANVHQQEAYAHQEAVAKNVVSVANLCLPIVMVIVAATYLIRRSIAAGIVRNDSDNQANVLTAKYEADAGSRPAAESIR